MLINVQLQQLQKGVMSKKYVRNKKGRFRHVKAGQRVKVFPVMRQKRYHRYHIEAT